MNFVVPDPAAAVDISDALDNAISAVDKAQAALAALNAALAPSSRHHDIEGKALDLAPLISAQSALSYVKPVLNRGKARVEETIGVLLT